MDQLPLEQVANTLRCPNQHCFDIAKQGYVNLLGAGDKRSKDPGDSREMVAARRRFLEAGHYEPIAIQLAGILSNLMDFVPSRRPLLVDAGCGEGYYLAQLRHLLTDSWPIQPHLVGFDISKWAMLAASKRLDGTWLVASNRSIPLSDASADAVLDVFGFCNFSEFARVLKPGGVLVRAGAGDSHLRQIRDVIYARQKAPAERLSVQPIREFSPVLSDCLEFDLGALETQLLQDLLLMTPHFYRASAEGKQRFATVTELSVTADIRFDAWRRC